MAQLPKGRQSSVCLLPVDVYSPASRQSGLTSFSYAVWRWTHLHWQLHSLQRLSKVVSTCLSMVCSEPQWLLMLMLADFCVTSCPAIWIYVHSLTGCFYLYQSSVPPPRDEHPAHLLLSLNIHQTSASPEDMKGLAMHLFSLSLSSLRVNSLYARLDRAEVPWCL